MIVTRDDDLASLCGFASIAFTGVCTGANAEILDIRLDQIDELACARHAGTRRSPVAVVLAPSVAGTQSVSAAVDPAGDLNKALTPGKVRAPYEARREDVGIWSLGTGLVAEYHSVRFGVGNIPARLGRKKGAKDLWRYGCGQRLMCSRGRRVSGTLRRWLGGRHRDADRSAKNESTKQVRKLHWHVSNCYQSRWFHRLAPTPGVVISASFRGYSPIV